MERVISVSLGDLFLKGKNRRYFEDKLDKQIRKSIKDIGYDKIYTSQGKMYIKAEERNFPEIISRLEKVFGLVYISPCIKTDKNIENIEKAILTLTKEKMESDNPKTFKVETNRVDKNFKPKSPKMSSDMGALVLRNIEGLSVDVHNPDIYIYIDIKEDVYVYIDRYEGVRGMPHGTSGKSLLLLSGGIDSPVAGYMMAKRGVELSAIHFHSYPFTSERAEDKVKKLASIMGRYVGDIKMYSINILEIQKAIKENCKPEEMTILSRRFMMRIAEIVAAKNDIQTIVTGESLGQVASQTMESMSVIERAIDMPILRPLIAMDKIEIVDIAREIETYETSIIPFVDSCTVFLPSNPLIRPRLDRIERSETFLDIDHLVNNAIENMEIYEIE